MRLCFSALFFYVGSLCSSVFLSLFLTCPAWCVLSRLKLSLPSVSIFPACSSLYVQIEVATYVGETRIAVSLVLAKPSDGDLPRHRRAGAG